MDTYESRKFMIFAIFIIVGIVYTFRLFFIQVIDDTYKLSAKNQALRYVTQYPARGLIYDRNNELLVYNQAAYDLMVIPKQVKNIDTTAFCSLTGITKEQFIEKMEKAKKYSYYKASIFEEQISAEAFSVISEKLYKYPGFFSQKRALRKYPNSIAAHVLGYISEVDKQTIEQQPHYKKGDYIGVSGLEKQYEKELRGKRGVKLLMVDVHNRIKGSYKNGEFDTLAIPGKDLVCSIDSRLQQYGEQLMQNKKGSIVAIEPATGEVLSLVSSPTYDPNLLVGRVRSDNYRQLARNDSLEPLFNRALMAKYPPGSIFKIVQALVGLKENAIFPGTGFTCNKALVGCHNHPHPADIEKAIQFSCNPYFYNTFKKIINQGLSSSIFKDSELGLAKWKENVVSFGLGQRLEIDLPNAKSGYIPGVDYYDRIYGQGRWAFTTIYSLSIGQGEIEVVPLQMANLAAIIANKGYYYTPHLIKAIGKEGVLREKFTVRHATAVTDTAFYALVHDAMEAVVSAPHGTARRARIDSIAVCGKTGTAENPHGEDHSVFIAFAPKENPQIAIAVYVENSGFGGTWAAPIASLMIEKYLTDSISDQRKEQRILEADFITKELEEN